jgi:hypothetical protein
MKVRFPTGRCRAECWRVAQVSRPLERRLTPPERAPDSRGIGFRVFSTGTPPAHWGPE